MKFALSFICTLVCVGFALFWAATMMWAKGMNSFSGNYPWGLFTRFWVVMPIALAIIGAVAVWLPLSIRGKAILLGSLVALCLASSLIDDRTAYSMMIHGLKESGYSWNFKGKLPTMLWGSVPLLFPLLAWTAEFVLSKWHKSTVTQTNGETTINYATASLILSITGVFSWQMGSVPAVIFGHLALKEYRSSMAQAGRGMAKAGIIIGWVTLAYHWESVIHFVTQAYQFIKK